MVHQHFRLVDDLTVAQNIHLGWDQTPRFVSRAALARRVGRMAEQLGYCVDPNAQIAQLSVGEQQRVEILKVLARGARVLILDEPTAVLTPLEAGELFNAVRTIAASGRGVIFISHKLDEVLAVSDRVTVLRAGRNVATLPTSACDARSLASLMVGQEVVSAAHEKTGQPGSAAVELQHASALNDRGLPGLRDV